MTDDCDHALNDDECPDWSALGCGDAAAIHTAIKERQGGKPGVPTDFGEQIVHDSALGRRIVEGKK
jgi:hypothetical protein